MVLGIGGCLAPAFVTFLLWGKCHEKSGAFPDRPASGQGGVRDIAKTTPIARAYTRTDTSHFFQANNGGISPGETGMSRSRLGGLSLGWEIGQSGPA